MEKEKSFSLPICSFKLDKNLTIIDVNDHLLNLLLYHSKEEFLNDVQNQWINCIHKNDVYHVIETLSKDVSSLERASIKSIVLEEKIIVIYGFMIKDNLFLIYKKMCLFKVV